MNVSPSFVDIIIEGILTNQSHECICVFRKPGDLIEFRRTYMQIGG